MKRRRRRRKTTIYKWTKTFHTFLLRLLCYLLPLSMWLGGEGGEACFIGMPKFISTTRYYYKTLTLKRDLCVGGIIRHWSGRMARCWWVATKQGLNNVMKWANVRKFFPSLECTPFLLWQASCFVSKLVWIVWNPIGELCFLVS